MAEARLAKIYGMLVAHNDEQTEKTFKWFITANMLAKLSGSNRAAVNTFVSLQNFTVCPMKASILAVPVFTKL